MLEAWRAHVLERAALGIPPLALSRAQAESLVELLRAPPAGEEANLVDLLTFRIPPGVDEAAAVKAGFLADVANGLDVSPLVSPEVATRLLGTMVGGFNVAPLIGWNLPSGLTLRLSPG